MDIKKRIMGVVLPTVLIAQTIVPTMAMTKPINAKPAIEYKVEYVNSDGTASPITVDYSMIETSEYRTVEAEYVYVTIDAKTGETLKYSSEKDFIYDTYKPGDKFEINSEYIKPGWQVEIKYYNLTTGEELQDNTVPEKGLLAKVLMITEVEKLPEEKPEDKPEDKPTPKPEDKPDTKPTPKPNPKPEKPPVVIEGDVIIIDSNRVPEKKPNKNPQDQMLDGIVKQSSKKKDNKPKYGKQTSSEKDNKDKTDKTTNKTDKVKETKKDEVGMRTYKNAKYYYNGNKKDEEAQKALIDSIRELLATRAGLLNDDYIYAVGQVIKNSIPLLESEHPNKIKLEQVKDALDRVRVSIIKGDIPEEYLSAEGRKLKGLPELEPEVEDINFDDDIDYTIPDNSNTGNTGSGLVQKLINWIR